MRTILFDCDKCGQPFESNRYDNPEPFVTEGETNILLEVKITITNPAGTRSSTTQVKQVCRECLKELGLDFTFSDRSASDYPMPISLQDKFIDMLSELGVKFEE